MSLVVRVVVTTLVLVAVIGGAFFAAFRLLRPASSYVVVEETTLVVHSGAVDVQQASGTTSRATGDTILRVGDRIRTGPDGFATITHMDGSTTALEPNTDLVVRRLDMAPGGVTTTSLHLQSGGAWNRLERLVDSSTRYELTTAAATLTARGTAFRVGAEASGRTAVEAVLDEVEVEAGGAALVLPAGYQTIIEPGQPAAQPSLVPARQLVLQVAVEGPVRPFLTDERGRSLGFHPEADVFSSQIPGATYSIDGPLRRLMVPDPAGTYQLVLKGQGQGGPYRVDARPVVSGRLAASRGMGLARPLGVQASGVIAGGQLLGADIQVRATEVQFANGFDGRGGAPPGSRLAVVQRQLRTSARAAETAAVLAAPTATATVTPTPSATSASPTPTVTATSTPDLRPPTAVPVATSTAPPAPTRPPEATATSVEVATATAPALTAVETVVPTVATPAAIASPTNGATPPAPTVAGLTPGATAAPTPPVPTSAPPTAPTTPRPTVPLPFELVASPTVGGLPPSPAPTVVLPPLATMVLPPTPAPLTVAPAP